MISPSPVIRPATTDDAAAITHILATGFHDDPPLKWLLPDPDERPQLSPAFFRPFVDLVLAGGSAFVMDDLSAAALWLHVDVHAEADDDPGDLLQILNEAIGADNTKRFMILDELFAASHPGHESHAYLMFVGTVPAHQSRGIGTKLLRHRLDELDHSGVPAYLEASSPRNAALYTRLGFAPIGDSVNLPDGPTLYPMWRPAAG